MSGTRRQERPSPERGNNRNDPLMTLFIAGIVLLLLLCVVLMLTASSRPPAGL